MNETTSENPLTCGEIAERGLIERYVAGTLRGKDAEAFEAHFIGCAHCQTELKLGLAIRRSLTAGEAKPTRRLPWRRIGWIGGALAAGIAGVFVVRSLARPNRWGDLGAVAQPPVYLGIEVRGAPAQGDSLFAVGMAAYQEGQFAAATQALRNALTAGVDSIPAEFFLGSSLLMANRAGDAADAYERVIASGDSPYLGEARLYRAKALLRTGDAATALSELQAVNSADEVSEWARALVDSVRLRLKR